MPQNFAILDYRESWTAWASGMSGSGRRLQKRIMLSGVPAALWEGLLARASPLTLERGQTLFVEGDDGDGCYAVVSGALKATVVAADGHERMLAVFSPGMIVGELALVDEQPRSATVAAIGRSRLAYISREAFFRYGDAHPELYRHALQVLARRLRGTSETVVLQDYGSIESRVARALLSLADSLGETTDTGRRVISQRVTQSDIAAMAGVARENASRVLNKWMRQRLLSRRDGMYCIENRDRLEEQING
jgi:CRP/FNR family transcriptional regulator, cyclic AMP receptor protein